MARLCIITLASLAACAEAGSFLSKSHLLQEEVKGMLLSQMAGRTDLANLARIQDELRPMFLALPKTETGRLEQATVRYALHRYFLHQYGWFVQGLDNAGEAWNASGASTVLKAFAPVYIQSLFEEHLRGHGMGLHELAVFAATMADLIHIEAVGRLQEIFATMQLPTSGPLQEDVADEALDGFITAFLSMTEVDISNLTAIRVSKEKLREAYPNLNDTKMWWQDQRQTYAAEQSARRNPFVQHQATFDSTAALVIEFGHNFGSYQNLECHTLKRKLVDIEHQGSGRVLLSKFYSKALDGAWEFMETVEYLRSQGALDESNPESPSVVIPNYMNSRMNCLTSSDFYALCCLNECDELMGKLESKIQAPSETPARIADVISKIQSDTVDAPRNISSTLMTRLEQIAQAHDGRVPLHGRLFSQWMHHAYPRECPFPHVSGAVTPMHPAEWAYTMGGDLIEVSREVMEAHAARLDASEKQVLELPWTQHEELVAEHKHGIWARRMRMPKADASLLKPLMALMGLVSFAVPLARGLRTALASCSANKVEQHLV